MVLLVGVDVCRRSSLPPEMLCRFKKKKKKSYKVGWLKRCFTFTETVGLLGTGAQDGHLDFHTAPEL